MKTQFKVKDPGRAMTHFIGMLMAIFAAVPLLIKAAREPDRIHLISLAIFIASMILDISPPDAILFNFFSSSPRLVVITNST